MNFDRIATHLTITVSLSIILSKQYLAMLFSNFSKCLFLKDLSLDKKQEKSKMQLFKYTSRPKRYQKDLILLRIRRPYSKVSIFFKSFLLYDF